MKLAFNQNYCGYGGTRFLLLFISWLGGGVVFSLLGGGVVFCLFVNLKIVKYSIK